MRKLGYLRDIPVDLMTNRQTVDLIHHWLVSGDKSRHIVTLNALIFFTSQENNALKKVIQNADLVTIDGYGIDLALRKNGYQNMQRLRGVDLTRDLLDVCSKNVYPVYFFGGTSKTVQEFRQTLSIKWPDLCISGIRNGYSDNQIRNEVIKEIIKKQPSLLLVGLGSPQQEFFLAEILPWLKKTVGIGVGGTFEILSARKREAPKFMRKYGWEWCFRILQDPAKIKRFPDLVKFWYKYLR